MGHSQTMHWPGPPGCARHGRMAHPWTAVRRANVECWVEEGAVEGDWAGVLSASLEIYEKCVDRPHSTPAAQAWGMGHSMRVQCRAQVLDERRKQRARRACCKATRQNT